MTNPPSLRVAEYYAGKSILITGATGFIGKVLVEKLLRCCPDIKTIYLLIRPKKGQSVQARIKDYINGKVFQNIKNREVFNKLSIIPGDILLEDLGISEEHRELLQQDVQIVFHIAACVRFDMILRDAVNLNIKGTHRTLTLAEGMKNLEVFQHVSTSYIRSDLEVLEEKLYPSKHKPFDLIQTLEWMDDELLQFIQPKLIAPEPNTYSYTKNLSEELVSYYAGKFPIVISRPSIVVAAAKEPLPGWVDNINGPTGIMIGGGKGLIRSMLCDENAPADIVPVDLVANGCILLSYLVGLEKPKEIVVCNCTHSDFNIVTWRRSKDYTLRVMNEYPFSVALWYPGGSSKTSRLLHEIDVFFTHMLPAYFVDLLLYLLGYKTFMVRVQHKVKLGLEMLHHYTIKKWSFDNTFFRSLGGRVSKEDKEIFYTDIEEINWKTFFTDYVKGARQYCLKEDWSTLPQARRLNRRLYYVNKITKLIMSLLFIYFIYCCIIRIMNVL